MKKNDPLVLVVRPQPQADAWANAIEEAGWRSLALPLIQIQGRDMAGYIQMHIELMKVAKAFMFVSRHAFHFWWSSLPLSFQKELINQWQSFSLTAPQIWVTGASTAQIVQEALRIDARYIKQPLSTESQDSESLWKQVAQHITVNDQVWIIRGSDAQDASIQGSGRSWLGDQIQKQGGRVFYLSSYQRLARDFSDFINKPCYASLESALLKRDQEIIWILNSDLLIQQAARYCRQLQGGQGIESPLHGQAWVSHQKMKALAQQAGWSKVQCVEGGLPFILAALKQQASIHL